MNRLANLALSVGETLVRKGGRLLFGIALDRAKELLSTPQQLGSRQLALNRALQKKAVDGALLAGQIAEVRAMKVDESGAIRAGPFVRFHPSRSERGLLLYSESLAGSMDPDESQPMMYRLKSSAGWRR
jgi:hypothetical protein